ncbi:hypothetical protein [Floridanema aerugineum]|uniref:Uncharacterized protein n=1 Tax=Floridaenema aerugineum BLCC-F46 TaxID=3153654 RepID=A0ABV4X721_9CYAN
MKPFFPVFVVALLATTPHFVGYTNAATNQNIPTRNFTFAQVPNLKADERLIPVSLPSEAEIILKGNQSKSGQIKAIDRQNLSIQRNGNSISIPLSQIVNVKFDNQGLVYGSDGRQFIRGERVLLPRSWEKIPLNAFILKDPIKGQAEVRLGPPVVDRTRLESIESIAKTNTYVVDEMRFNLADKTMTIIVTPY